MIVSYEECALGAYKGCYMGTKEHTLSRIYSGCLKGVFHGYDRTCVIKDMFWVLKLASG